MQPRGIRFLDFPREIRDIVYTQLFCHKYTVRIPRYLLEQYDTLETTAQEKDPSHTCEASPLGMTNALTVPFPHTCKTPVLNAKAGPWPSLVILQTSKQVNEEAAQSFYAVGSFYFQSDVLMEGDLSLLGHKLQLLRTMELHFVIDFYQLHHEKDELISITNAICSANIRFLAGGQEGRRYTCRLVFHIFEGDDPPEVQWWDALEELDTFERVVIAVSWVDETLEDEKVEMTIPYPSWSFCCTYGIGWKVRGSSGMWETIKQDTQRAILRGQLMGIM